MNFLAENELIIPIELQTKLYSLFNRLSPIEQEIVVKLSNFNQPRSREELKANLDFPSTDFISGLESLQYRYLVTKIKQKKTLFQLSPIFREYIKHYHSS